MMKTRPIARPNDWRELEPHPLSKLVEFGVGLDLDALAEHMRQHGYDPDEAIVLHDGKILDGRHRHQAAIVAGVTPTFREFAGVNAAAYVCKKLYRQHLNESQRAMMAATLAKVLPANSSTAEGGRPANLPDKPPSQSQVAAMLNVSERSVRDAAKVQRSGTEELGQAVLDRTLSVSDAAKVAAEPPEVQQAAIEAVRNGQARTASEAAGNGTAGPRSASAVFCDRCQRTGPARNCPCCKELRAAARGKPGRQPGDDAGQLADEKAARKAPGKCGETVFSLREFNDHAGKMIYLLDKLAFEAGLVHERHRRGELPPVRMTPQQEAIARLIKEAKQKVAQIQEEVRRWRDSLKEQRDGR
jgi:hypothetical protein